MLNFPQQNSNYFSSMNNNAGMIAPTSQNFSYNQANIPNQQMLIGGLNGRVVESIDMVKVTDVPVGSYGFFPKADLSAVYLKTWNNNGTTNITTFTPLTETLPSSNSNDVNSESFNKLTQKIDSIEGKLNNFIAMFTQTSTSSQITPIQQLPPQQQTQTQPVNNENGFNFK